MTDWAENTRAAGGFALQALGTLCFAVIGAVWVANTFHDILDFTDWSTLWWPYTNYDHSIIGAPLWAWFVAAIALSGLGAALSGE